MRPQPRHWRAALITLGAAALTACGFTPMHVTPGGQATFSNVALQVDDGKDEQDRAAGFEFARAMRARIGQPANPTYRLSVSPRIGRVGLGLTAQDRATRFDRVFSADWVLTDARTGERLAHGRSRDTATFTADADPYRLASNDDRATTQITRMVADDVLTEVALAISDLAAAPAKQP